VASGIKAFVCLALSGGRAAEAEGLDQVFRAAGLSGRTGPCSMCLAIESGHASKAAESAQLPSKRNFKGA